MNKELNNKDLSTSNLADAMSASYRTGGSQRSFYKTNSSRMTYTSGIKTSSKKKVELGSLVKKYSSVEKKADLKLKFGSPKGLQPGRKLYSSKVIKKRSKNDELEDSLKKRAGSATVRGLISGSKKPHDKKFIQLQIESPQNIKKANFEVEGYQAEPSSSSKIRQLLNASRSQCMSRNSSSKKTLANNQQKLSEPGSPLRLFSPINREDTLAKLLRNKVKTSSKNLKHLGSSNRSYMLKRIKANISHKKKKNPGFSNQVQSVISRYSRDTEYEQLEESNSEMFKSMEINYPGRNNAKISQVVKERYSMSPNTHVKNIIAQKEKNKPKLKKNLSSLKEIYSGSENENENGDSSIDTEYKQNMSMIAQQKKISHLKKNSKNSVSQKKIMVYAEEKSKNSSQKLNKRVKTLNKLTQGSRLTSLHPSNKNLRRTGSLKKHSKKVVPNFKEVIAKGSSHNLSAARDKLNELKNTISYINNKSVKKIQERVTAPTKIDLKKQQTQNSFLDRTKDQYRNDLSSKASLRLSGHVTPHKKMETFTNKSNRSNSFSETRNDLSRNFSPKIAPKMKVMSTNHNKMMSFSKISDSNCPESPKFRQTINDRSNIEILKINPLELTIYNRSPPNEQMNASNRSYLNNLLKGSHYSKGGDTNPHINQFQSINDSQFNATMLGSIQNSTFVPNQNSQVIKWNIELVKTNSQLKKENRDLKAFINQIENLVTSANDNLVKKTLLGEIKEEADETKQSKNKDGNEHRDDVMNHVNNFIHEMANLQTEIQSQKTYTQKIEEELRRLKTLSFYYPMGPDNVIPEAMMSDYGSESKPTTSHLDFNEIRRKSKQEGGKFEENLAIRSFTQSPMLLENKTTFSNERLQEFMFEDQNNDFTPKSFKRMNKNLGLKTEETPKLRSSVGDTGLRNKTNFENMIQTLEQQKNVKNNHVRSNSSAQYKNMKNEVQSKDEMKTPRELDFTVDLKASRPSKTQSVPHSPVVNSRFNNNLKTMNLNLKKEVQNEPSPERKANPLRDSHNPFLITNFGGDDKPKKKIDPLRDSNMIQAGAPITKNDKSGPINFLEKNIKNLKDFIKSKKVDEEITSYIGFVIDMLKKECQQFYISGQNWKNQLETIQDQWDETHSKYNVLKIKYSRKRSDLNKLQEKYKCFNDNLVQYKDNPKELVWEFKRLMLDNEMKAKEIGFLKNRVEDLKLSDENVLPGGMKNSKQASFTPSELLMASDLRTDNSVDTGSVKKGLTKLKSFNESEISEIVGNTIRNKSPLKSPKQYLKKKKVKSVYGKSSDLDLMPKIGEVGENLNKSKFFNTRQEAEEVFSNEDSELAQSDNNPYLMTPFSMEIPKLDPKSLRNSKTLEAEANTLGEDNQSAVFDSMIFAAENNEELQHEKLKRKQSEETMKFMNTDLKYQEKEIFFLRDENIKAKQEIDNYRLYIEDLIRKNGIQIDQQAAEMMNLNLEQAMDKVQTNENLLRNKEINGEESIENIGDDYRQDLVHPFQFQSFRYTP